MKYYDDALEAAWMADKFGMDFCHEDGSPIRKECAEDFIESSYHRGHAYVAPNSLHLLEPQVGDLLQSTKGVMGGTSCGYLLEKAFRGGLSGRITTDEKWTIARRFGDGGRIDCHWATPSEWRTIIQRNGIAFMMPKEEA